MTKWKVAVYLRLSNDDGDKAESNSITNQRSLIKEFINKTDDLKIKDYYIDDGYSGTNFDRPDFNRMIDDVKIGKINSIIVKDLSRLGRNYIEVGNYIEHIFPLYNIRFIAINDNVDSYKDPSSVNNVIVPFKNLMNDEYARDISNKVRSVLNNKKEAGQFIGSVAPYGYLKDPKDKHKFIIDEYASNVVKKIFKMILNGKSKQEVIEFLNKKEILPPRLYAIKDKNYKFKITDEMKQWDRYKLSKILRNKEYTGELIQGKKLKVSHKIKKNIEVNEEDWIRIPNHHKAIIKLDEFEQVQDILHKRDIKVNKDKKYNIFSGYLKCAECNNNLISVKSGKYEYYNCRNYKFKKECTSHSIKQETLEVVVLDLLNAHLELLINAEKQLEKVISEEDINYDYEIQKNKLEILNNDIEKFNKLKESLKNDLLLEFITKEEYLDYEAEYNSKLKNMKHQKKNIEKEINELYLNNKKSDNLINKFEFAKVDKLNKQIVDETIENIFVSENGNIKIKFKYEDKYFQAIDFIKQKECAII